MPGGRKPLPLFELMSERESARRDVPQVVIPPGPNPTRGTGPNFLPVEPKPLVDAGVTPRRSLLQAEATKGNGEGGAAALSGRAKALLAGSPVMVHRTSILIGLGLGLAVIALVWWLGTRYGGNQVERDFARTFGAPVDPLRPDAAAPTVASPTPERKAATPAPTPAERPAAPASGAAAGGRKEPAEAGATRAATPAAGTTVPVDPMPSGSGKVLTRRGFSEQDPRQEGWNYLILGVLGREDAWEAMSFLARNGVETFAVRVDVPVDRRAMRANTSPRYQLVAEKGVPSREFGSRQAERDRLRQDVIRLGAIWKKDHKGSASFSDAFWLKN